MKRVWCMPFFFFCLIYLVIFWWANYSVFENQKTVKNVELGALHQHGAEVRVLASIGWFSNKTEMSVDDGKVRGKE